MLKDVLINIKGTQGSGNEQDVIELTTDGRFGEKNGGFYITYDESEMIGIDNVNYNTPAGEMLIGIFGEKVEHNFKKNGGSLSLKYTIDQNLNFISRNTVNITVREVKK